MKAIKRVKFKRRREGATDYYKRLALVKGGLYRVVVRKTNRRIIGQVIEYNPEGDKVIAGVDSSMLKKYGWPSRANKATAYLTGMLLAKRFKENKECILDIGLNSSVKNSLPFVFAKGCADAGMKIRGNFEIPEEAYNMSSVADYAKQLGSGEKLNKQFGAYIKEGISIEQLPKLFKEVQEKIMEEKE
ncbi:MAG: 50S ribosomal protein L18 [Candidatus Micrarchaeia archaeon]